MHNTKIPCQTQKYLRKPRNSQKCHRATQNTHAQHGNTMPNSKIPLKTMKFSKMLPRDPEIHMHNTEIPCQTQKYLRTTQNTHAQHENTMPNSKIPRKTTKFSK